MKKPVDDLIAALAKKFEAEAVAAAEQDKALPSWLKFSIGMYIRKLPRKPEIVHPLKVIVHGTPAFVQAMHTKNKTEIHIANHFPEIPWVKRMVKDVEKRTFIGLYSYWQKLMGLALFYKGEKVQADPAATIAHEISHEFNLSDDADFEKEYASDLNRIKLVTDFLEKYQTMPPQEQTRKMLLGILHFSNFRDLLKHAKSYVYFLPLGHGGDVAKAQKEAFVQLFAMTIAPEACHESLVPMKALFPRSAALVEKIVAEFNAAYALHVKPEADLDPVQSARAFDRE